MLESTETSLFSLSSELWHKNSMSGSRNGPLNHKFGVDQLKITEYDYLEVNDWIWIVLQMSKINARVLRFLHLNNARTQRVSALWFGTKVISLQIP